MEKIGIDGRVIPTNGQFKSFDNGGKGSGNFGHAGRPGEVGGSAPAGTSSASSAPEGKQMPLASFMKLAKSTPLELRQTSFHGGEPRNPDWRSVGKVQTTGMYLGDSYLDLPKASLTEIEWDDEKGVGKLKCYDAGFRDYNEEEKAALAEWKKITDTDEYRDMALRDAYTDTSGTYWKEKAFWEDKGMEYMFHTKKGGKLRTQNPDKKDDRGFSVDEIRDDSIKGRLWGEYEIRRKEDQNNSLENIVTNAIVEALNGGKGSGNFGHSGRPGEVGGSAPAGNGQSKTDPEEKKEIKGGTKAEHEAIMEMVKSYAVDERGIDGVYEDVEAAAYPHEDHTTFQKAKRWLEAGGGEVSYEGAYKTLKDLYGDSFKPETYLTKGGDEENGDWKYKDGQPYVWSTYLYKFAKAIADEMDKRKRGNSLEGVVVNAVIEALNGGKGSGNFGHAGRPGEVGGSAPAGTSSASSDGDDIKKKLARLEELEKKDREEELNADEIDELHDLTYDKDVKYALSHPEKKSAKEKFKLSQKEADAVSDVLPGLHASDNVGRNIITSQEKREAKAFVRKASKEELADKFYDKNTTARERAALYWAMGDEYNFRGVGYVGDDLLYGDKQAFLISSARKKEHKKSSKSGSGKNNSPSLKGKSLYEKVHMIEPGDEVHIKPSSKVPNFPKEIKVDYVEDGTIHYGSSETSDGYTYPAWAIDDIKKIIRKK